MNDLTSMTQDELRELMNQVNTLYSQRQAEEVANIQARREVVGSAIETLTNLLGPAEGEAGTGNILAIQRYDAQALGENAGEVLTFVVSALEQITRTLIDSSHIVSRPD